MACRITWYSSQMPLPPSMSRAIRAISRDFPQEFLLIREIISGVALGKKESIDNRILTNVNNLQDQLMTVRSEI